MSLTGRRAPLPLRLLSSSWDSAELLVVYKPLGQRLTTSSYDNHKALRQSAVLGMVAPDPTDLEDSFFGRLIDNVPPGATPLPLLSTSTCFQHRVSSNDDHPANAAMHDKFWQTFSRGVQPVAMSPSVHSFLSNCVRVRGVETKYQVLVRVPECVADRMRKSAQRESKKAVEISAEFSNRYLREHLRKRSTTLTSEQDQWFVESLGPLPACCHTAASTNGFYDFPRGGVLQLEGQVSCTLLRPGTPTRSKTVESLQQRTLRDGRLARLFAPPTNHGSSCSSCDVCQGAVTSSLPAAEADRWQLQRCGGPLLELGSTDRFRVRSTFDFRVLRLAEDYRLALYEVTSYDGFGRQEEVVATFAANNLFVVGDAIHDPICRRLVTHIHDETCTALNTHRSSGKWSAREKEWLQQRPASAAFPSLLQSVLLSVIGPVTGAERAKLGLLRAYDETAVTVLKALQSSSSSDHSWRRIASLLPTGPAIACTRISVPKTNTRSNVQLLQHVLLTSAQLSGEGGGAFPKLPKDQSFDCNVYETVGVLPSFLEALQSKGAGCNPYREEEVGVLYCSVCRQAGHTLANCVQAHMPRRIAPPVVAAEDKASAPLETLLMDDKERPEDPSLPSTVAELREIILNPPPPNNSSIGDEETRDSEDGLVAIPNERPTYAFRPRDVQRDRQRPSLHRRRVTCGYCHGPHHITECPRIPGADGTSEGISSPVDARALHDAARSDPTVLFCIRCGEHGHLYQACPTIPKNLHQALYCPICLGAKKTVLHSPVACPRRAEVPENFAPNGVHQRYMSKPQGKKNHNGQHVGLISSAMSQRKHQQ